MALRDIGKKLGALLSEKTSSPSRETVPPKGLRMSRMVFIVVDLPQPLAPMMQTNSPSSTVKLTPWTISVFSYPHLRSVTLSMLTTPSSCDGR